MYIVHGHGSSNKIHCYKKTKVTLYYPLILLYLLYITITTEHFSFKSKHVIPVAKHLTYSVVAIIMAFIVSAVEPT